MLKKIQIWKQYATSNKEIKLIFKETLMKRHQTFMSKLKFYISLQLCKQGTHVLGGGKNINTEKEKKRGSKPSLGLGNCVELSVCKEKRRQIEEAKWGSRWKVLLKFCGLRAHKSMVVKRSDSKAKVRSTLLRRKYIQNKKKIINRRNKIK